MVRQNPSTEQLPSSLASFLREYRLASHLHTSPQYQDMLVRIFDIMICRHMDARQIIMSRGAEYPPVDANGLNLVSGGEYQLTGPNVILACNCDGLRLPASTHGPPYKGVRTRLIRKFDRIHRLFR